MACPFPCAQAEFELELKALELECAEDMEKALEQANLQKGEEIKAAVAEAERAFYEKHRSEMEKAEAALAELEMLRLQTNQLEQTITRLSPREPRKA